MRHFSGLVGLLLIFGLSFSASADEISVTVNGKTYSCSAGGNAEKYGCKCEYAYSCHSLQYTKFNVNTGESTRVKNLGEWCDGDKGLTSCLSNLKINPLCR